MAATLGHLSYIGVVNFGHFGQILEQFFDHFELLWICVDGLLIGCTACCTTNPQQIEASGV